MSHCQCWHANTSWCSRRSSSSKTAHEKGNVQIWLTATTHIHTPRTFTRTKYRYNLRIDCISLLKLGERLYLNFSNFTSFIMQPDLIWVSIGWTTAGGWNEFMEKTLPMHIMRSKMQSISIKMHQMRCKIFKFTFAIHVLMEILGFCLFYILHG